MSDLLKRWYAHFRMFGFRAADALREAREAEAWDLSGEGIQLEV